MPATPAADLPDALGPFERALADGDTLAAVDLVESVLDAGVPPVSVLCELITPVQRRVGERWQRGEWSVAREHIATGVSSAAVDAVARRVRTYPVTKGTIVVGCAEREWHALAATVVGTALRARGWNVAFLGAAIPAERLASYLHRVGPDVVAVSCSVAGGLPSTRRFIEAATAAGIPVIAGGAAFGSDDLRARALGATAWAPDLPGALDLVERLPAAVEQDEPPLPAGALAEQRTLELGHHGLVGKVSARWHPVRGTAEHPGCPGDGELGDLDAIAHDCVGQPLRALQAALLTGDGRLVREIAEWVRSVLAARSVPGPVFTALRTELLAAIPDLPRARSLLAENWPA